MVAHKQKLDEQAEEQAIYLEKLRIKAVEQVKAMIAGGELINFDPQGRVMVEVDSPDNGMPGYSPANTGKTLVSLGLDSVPELDSAFKKATNPDSDKKLGKLLDKYTAKDFQRGSVTALHQEMAFHLAGAKRVTQKVCAKQLEKIDSVLIDKAYQEAEAALNKKILKVFAKALKNSINFDGSINIAKLNGQLDEARANLGKLAQQEMMEAITRKTGVALDPNEVKKDEIKHEAVATTATANDILHIDSQLGLASLVKGTNETAHHRQATTDVHKGGSPSFAHRQIVTCKLNDEGAIKANNNPRIQIRTPSIALKDDVTDAEAIADVSKKFKEITTDYKLAENLEAPAADVPKAFIYNLHTASNDPFGDEKKNKQTQSAGHILKGMHVYNQGQMHAYNQGQNTGATFALVQNISVNGHGDQLSTSAKNPLTKEASLMSEMAMLHTLSETLIDEQQDKVKKLFEGYNEFLNGYNEGNPTYFSESTQGANAIALCQEIKNDIKAKPIEKLTSTTDLAKGALSQLLARDGHHRHSNSKTVQALSVFTEKASISGCKSGNERAEAINKRVAILDFLANNPEKADKLPEMIRLKAALASNAKPSGIFAGLSDMLNRRELNSALNKATNSLAVQAAANLISLTDQHSSAKVEPPLSYLPEMPTNWTAYNTAKFIFESTFTIIPVRPIFYVPIMNTVNANHGESSDMTNLKQSRAGKNQAHKGFVKNLTKGINKAFDNSAHNLDEYNKSIDQQANQGKGNTTTVDASSQNVTQNPNSIEVAPPQSGVGVTRQNSYSGPGFKADFSTADKDLEKLANPPKFKPILESIPEVSEEAENDLNQEPEQEYSSPNP